MEGDNRGDEESGVSIMQRINDLLYTMITFAKGKPTEFFALLNEKYGRVLLYLDYADLYYKKMLQNAQNRGKK